MILPYYFTDNFSFREKVFLIRHRNSVEEETVLEVPGILLDDVAHVADLLLQLLAMGSFAPQETHHLTCCD